LGLAARQIRVERARGLPAIRNLAFLTAFASNAQPSFRAVEIFQIEPHKLADAEAATVKQLEDKNVA
jgi:hypothetical protein